MSGSIESPLCMYLMKDRLSCQASGFDGRRKASTDPTGAKEGLCLAALMYAKRTIAEAANNPLSRDQINQLIAIEQERGCDTYDTHYHAEQHTDKHPAFLYREALMGELLADQNMVAALESGQVLSGLEKLGDFDALNYQVIRYFMTTTGIIRGKQTTDTATKVSKMLSKRGFNGQFRDLRATVLVNNLNPDPIAQDTQLFRYLGRAELFSSAKGVVGDFIFEAGLVVRRYTSEHTDYLFLLSTFEHLTGQKGLAALDQALAESYLNWQEAQREALRNTVLAGLPTLGKRR